MSACSTTAGLFSDLQKLDEAGRDRILNLLSPDNVKDVLRASLRELDKAANSTVPQPLPHGNMNHGPSHPITVEHGNETAHGRNASSTKRDRSAIIFGYRKRLRAEEESQQSQTAIKREIVEIESDEENGHITDLTDETSTIPPDEHTQQESSIGNNNAVSPNEPREMQQTLLPTPCYARGGFARGDCVSIEKLPEQVRNELERHIKEMWSANQLAMTTYITNIRDLRKPTPHERCSSYTLALCSLADSLVSFGPKDADTIDDKLCTSGGYPCAHIWWDEEEQTSVMCLVPLSAKLRKGKRWDEIEYWVLPEEDIGTISN